MLAETYIFFGDIYFLQNFIIKCAVLFLTLKTLRIEVRGRKRRLLLIAGLGTLFEIAGLLVCPYYNLFILAVHLLESPVMLFALLCDRRECLKKGIILVYFYILLINGVIEVFYNIIGYAWAYVFLVCLASFITVLVVDYIRVYIRMHKGIYPVEIHLDDIVWTVRGYYDSGNRLTDPYTGKEVHIISAHMAKRLSLSNEQKLYIPYQALGNTDGLIEIMYVEHIRIRKDGSWMEQQKVPIAIANATLLEGKPYDMILNEKIW